jgi:hypothetical protein
MVELPATEHIVEIVRKVQAQLGQGATHSDIEKITDIEIIEVQRQRSEERLANLIVQKILQAQLSGVERAERITDVVIQKLRAGTGGSTGTPDTEKITEIVIQKLQVPRVGGAGSSDTEKITEIVKRKMKAVA